MKRTTGLIAVALATLCTPSWSADDQVFVNPSEVKWGPAPPNFPMGAKLAVLYGDPGKAGPLVLRLSMPANYKIAPHWHTSKENLTVISGTLYLGDGDTMDMKKAHGLKTGGYHYLPAKAHHYAFSKTATVVQANTEGPFDINYINPADDPSKAAAPAAKPDAKKAAEPAKKAAEPAKT
jgi:hypothetical protein